MFGTYRTLLALMVVAQHIGGIPSIGSYAVFGFYILSGYLMTFIMHRNYGYTANGLYKYAINRFLRIYPIYWISILITLCIIFYVGEEYSRNYHPMLILPENYYDILRNIFIFFPDQAPPRLTPPAWALTVELFFYILIGLGISKDKKAVNIWFALSLLYHLTRIIFFPELDRYYGIFAASLAFSTGALIYHYKNQFIHYFYRIKYIKFELFPILIFSAFLINWYIGYKTHTGSNFTFYCSYFLCSLLVLVLSQQKKLYFISKKFDNIMGDFSYPIYLIHYQIGLLVILLLNLFDYSYSRPDIELMLITIPFIFLFALLIIVTIEKPIELIRHKIKIK